MDHIEECGMTEMPAAALPAPEMDKGNPVTVNVSMNASGKEHVADLLDMMKNAGLGGAEPVGAKMLSPRMDMERLSAMMDEPGFDDKEMPLPSDEPDMEEIEEGGMKDQLIQAMEKIAADDSGELLHKAMRGAMGPDVQNYLQDMYNEVSIDHGLHPDDDHDDIEQRMWDEIEQDYGMGEGYANEPEAQYGDMSDAIPDGNDLNRKKKSYAATQDGDNPMAVENIKAALYAALTEKKKTMVKGPDGKMVPDYAADGKGKGDLAKGKKDTKTTEGRGKVMAGRGRGKDKLMAGRGRGKKK